MILFRPQQIQTSACVVHKFLTRRRLLSTFAVEVEGSGVQRDLCLIARPHTQVFLPLWVPALLVPAVFHNHITTLI